MGDQKQANGDGVDDAPLPQMDFTTFIMSLATSALMNMGEIPDERGEKVAQLPLAKQTIDILEMLQAKTQGNLAPEEERLLKSNLHELRMMYVAKTGG